MGIRIGLLNTGRLGSFVLARESDFDVCLRFCPGSGLSQSICFFATPVPDELRAEIASKFDSAVFTRYHQVEVHVDACHTGMTNFSV